MGDIAEYYRDNGEYDIYDDETFGGEYYKEIWTKYQKENYFGQLKQGTVF